MQSRPDILVVTGHDGIKEQQRPEFVKITGTRNISLNVLKKRRYEPDYDKLCIFAGPASAFEAIMAAGPILQALPEE